VREFKALAVDAQREVEDFIAFKRGQGPRAEPRSEERQAGHEEDR
jgi:hypothetical protein